MEVAVSRLVHADRSPASPLPKTESAEVHS
jgi:hypothetical protein